MSLDIKTEGLTGNGYIPQYKSYVAAISQSGTDDIVAIEYYNTFGSVVWTRLSGKQYVLTTEVPYVINKTHIAGFGGWDGNANPYMPIHDGTSIVGYYTLYSGTNEFNNVAIQLEVVDTEGALVDVSTLVGATHLHLPEIRFYG